MTSRAFVIEPTNRVSCDDAARYGTITYIFPAGARRASSWSDQYGEDVLLALRGMGFDPQTDSFVVAGHMMNLVKATAAIVREFRYVKFLFFDATRRTYRDQWVGWDGEVKA